MQGVLDRFGQIEPKVLLTADGYWYNGKPQNSLPRVQEVLTKLPSVQQVLVIPYLNSHPDIAQMPRAKLFREALNDQTGGEIAFERVAFNHPLFSIVFLGHHGCSQV